MKLTDKEMQFGQDICDALPDYEHNLRDCWSAARILINKGYHKQEWISVEERLPERNGRYLAHCLIEGQSLVAILWYEKYNGFDEEVTHWMHLPDPPHTPERGTEE